VYTIGLTKVKCTLNNEKFNKNYKNTKLNAGCKNKQYWFMTLFHVC